MANLWHYSLPKWAFRKAVMTVEEASQIIWIQNNKSTLHALMESPAALWTRHQYEWHMSEIFSLTIGGCSNKLNLLQISSASVETQHWTSRTWSLRKPVHKITYKLQTWEEDMDREHASENCLNSMLKALPAFLLLVLCYISGNSALLLLKAKNLWVAKFGFHQYFYGWLGAKHCRILWLYSMLHGWGIIMLI